MAGDQVHVPFAGNLRELVMGFRSEAPTVEHLGKGAVTNTADRYCRPIALIVPRGTCWHLDLRVERSLERPLVERFGRFHLLQKDEVVPVWSGRIIGGQRVELVLPFIDPLARNLLVQPGDFLRLEYESRNLDPTRFQAAAILLDIEPPECAS